MRIAKYLYTFFVVKLTNLILCLSLSLSLSISPHLFLYHLFLTHPRRRGPYGSENIFSVLFLRALRSMIVQTIGFQPTGSGTSQSYFPYNIIILMPHALWSRARIIKSIFSEFPSPARFHVYKVYIPLLWLILYKLQLLLYINR